MFININCIFNLFYWSYDISSNLTLKLITIMKLKPILLKVNNSNIWLHTKEDSCNYNKLELTNDDEPYGIYLHRKVAYQIYLIDQEADIKEGDWLFDAYYLSTGEKFLLVGKDQSVETANLNCGSTQRYSKIICSTDKSLMTNSLAKKLDPESANLNSWEDYTLPQLSEQSIKLLIDYYNEQGKMPDKVEIEEVFVDMFRKIVHPNRVQDGCSKELKLNSQETVDITIPEERMYSKEEVEELCSIAYEYGGANCIGSDRHKFTDFKKQNLK